MLAICQTCFFQDYCHFTNQNFTRTIQSVNRVKYQAKAKKIVVVLSTLHKGSARQQDGKKKPDSVLYTTMPTNKCGVDMLDAVSTDVDIGWNATLAFSPPLTQGIL